MRTRISSTPFLHLLLILLFVSNSILAQVQITFPEERAVFQRKIDGTSVITVSGSYSTPIDKLEIKAEPITAGQGTPLPWITLQAQPSGGVFSGSVTLSGGWYQLEVRGLLNNQVVASATLSKMGVGEVFIISGQSNAQGMDEIADLPLPPGATDDRVNFINFNNEILESLNDFPPPVFEQLQLQGSPHILGPRGHTAWCWGLLGDMLASRLNVPILFINTAWSGTSITNWMLSSQNISSTSVYSDLYRYPDQMPYGNLRLALQHYVSQYGARSILWMLGESDNFPVRMSTQDFKSKLEFLIQKLSTDTNKSMNWVISRTSRSSDNSGNSFTRPEIIDAQNAVLEDLKENTFSGPETDELAVPRLDKIHFYGVEALTTLATAWSNSLNSVFFSKANPLLPSPPPSLSSSCGTDNNSLSLTLPEGYNSYSWMIENDGNSREQTGRSLIVSSPGTYYGKVKDLFGNTLRTQKITFNKSFKPETPTITGAAAQQVCADSTFLFTVNPDQTLFRWYQQNEVNAVLQTGTQFNATTGGTYFVQSQNAYGCLSDYSEPVTLYVREKIPTPVIEKTGPFNLTASSDASGLYSGYIWMRDQEIVTSSDRTITVTLPGNYSVKAYATFQLAEQSLICPSPSSNAVFIGKDQATNLVIYPNPGPNGEVFIESRLELLKARISVYDKTGKMILKQTSDLAGGVRIPLPTLSPGDYIIRIEAKDTDFKKQIIIR